MRLFPVTAAIAGALAASLVMANPSSAISNRKPPNPIVCQAMSGNQFSPNVVSGCDRPGITGRSGTLKQCPTGTGTCIAWATGKEIDFTFSFTVPTTSRCGSGLVEVDVIGRARSASGAGTKRLVGTTVAYDACLTQQINVVIEGLVPGTSFTIG